MAFYVNGNILDLSTVKLPDGKWYQGQDEIRNLLVGAWRELEDKFWSKGLPVRFITPGIRSGVGKGNQGYQYPRVVNYKTRRGTTKIAWAEKVEIENGKTMYFPVSRDIGLNEKTLSLGPEDIEEALFMFLFNSFLLSPKNPSGRTYLEDKEADAQKYEASETQAATISYWLYRKESPFYANDTKIATLCLAWGVNPENKSIVYRKQLLSEAVKRAERQGNKEYDMAAFNQACERIKDGQDTRDVDSLALIQLCIQRKIVKMDEEKSAWVILSTDGKPVKTIVKVPPHMISNATTIFKKHLVSSPDDYFMLQSAAGNEPEPSRLDVVVLQEPLPEVITEEYIINEMKWPVKKKLYKFLGEDVTGATLDTINPRLIEYFVVQKRTVPFTVKE